MLKNRSIDSYIRQVVTHHLNTLDDNKMPPINLYHLVWDDIEAALIDKTLEYTGGNETKTAQLLGISRGTLRHRRQRYGRNK